MRFIEAGDKAGDDTEVEVRGRGHEEADGRQMIADVLYAVAEADEDMFGVMRALQQQYVYCMLMYGKETGLRISDDQLYTYNSDNCFPAEANGCGMMSF
jgi:hypothetical protein